MEIQEISLYDLVQIVRARRRVLFMTMVVTTTLALLVALFSTPVYRAEIVLAPVSTDMDERGTSALGSLGGLASLAGLGGSSGGSTEQNVAILRSRVLADRFVAEGTLSPLLFPDKWDEKTKKWKTSAFSHILAPVSSLVASITGDEQPSRPSDGGPSPDEIYRAFDSIRTVSKDKETGLVTLGMQSRDPARAAAWANDYVRAANDYIRAQQVNEAKQRLQFLSEQLQKTNLTEIQNALYRLVESETKRSMIANVREEFAFKVIDPASSPELRTSPKRKLLVLIGLMGGFMLGLGIILIQNYLSVMRNARQG